MIHLFSLLLLTIFIWYKVSSPTFRCNSVSTPLGKIKNITLSAGMIPQTNLVTGTLECKSLEGRPVSDFHQQLIKLPLWYCPTNLFSNYVDLVEELVDRLCTPGSFADSLDSSAMRDVSGTPLIFRESHIIESAYLTASDNEGRRAPKLKEANSLGEFARWSIKEREPLWVPMSIPELFIEKIIVFEHISTHFRRSTAGFSAPSAEVFKLLYTRSQGMYDARFDEERHHWITVTKITVEPHHKYMIVALAEPCQDRTCSICLDQVTREKSHNCGHWFHRECIKEWLEKYSKNCCPNCKHPIHT